MMNEYDIDRAVDIANEHFPHLEKYARFLSDWRDTVNENSDGWAYWSAGRRCADKLAELLSTMKEAVIEDKPLASEKEFIKALTPIKTAATKFKLPVPILGAENDSTKEYVNVVFYYGVKAKDSLIDHCVQNDPPSYWVPAIADFNRSKNLYNLMSMANIDPTSWQTFLVSKFGFDPATPTEEGLLNAGVPEDRIAYAMKDALDQADHWSDPDTFLWQYDNQEPQNITEEQVYEIIAESRGRGIPVIAFRESETEIRNAISADNSIMVSSANGIYVGLCDPFNGYGWSPQNLNQPVYFRPSLEGQLHLVDDDHTIFEYVGPEAYKAKIEATLAAPVMLSTRSQERYHLAPAQLHDERSQGYGHKM